MLGVRLTGGDGGRSGGDGAAATDSGAPPGGQCGGACGGASGRHDGGVVLPPPPTDASNAGGTASDASREGATAAGGTPSQDSGRDGALDGCVLGGARYATGQAAALCLDRGLKVSTCYPRVLGPLPVDRIRRWAEGMERIIVPELNVTGQFARLVRADIGLAIDSLTKATGLPFTAQQLADYIADAVQPVDDSGVWEAGVTGEARVG